MVQKITSSLFTESEKRVGAGKVLPESMKKSLKAMNIFAIFIIFVFVAVGENLGNYDHELSTIKLLYYRPT